MPAPRPLHLSTLWTAEPSPHGRARGERSGSRPGWTCLAAAALLLASVAAPARAAVIELSFTAPSTYADNGAFCGIPDSTQADPVTGALLEGSPMSSLQSIRLYGYLFKPGPWGPEPALRDSIDARGMEGQRLTIRFEAPPGSMGFVWLTAVNAGMESCALGGYTFAIPAVDPAVEASYELIWRKP